MSLQVGSTALTNGPRRWDVLSTFMTEQGYKTFVEVGCKEGRTTGHILANVPDSRVIAIDPWIVQPATTDKTKETYESWDFQSIEKQFWENVGEHKDRCEMLRLSSETAAKTEKPDSSYDLIFIDALHDYEHVKQDIALWWPKVRIGGMLCGHDFNHKWPGCERAVAESFDLMGVGVAPDSVWFVIKVSEDQYVQA
jgi:predicted O-methyltransferase YrrM